MQKLMDSHVIDYKMNLASKDVFFTLVAFSIGIKIISKMMFSTDKDK
jgi:hypothetical protein